MSDAPAGPRRWYRSLYWRIASGFIAFLAAMLLAQGGLFLWLSTAREETLPPRLLADLAEIVAADLGDALDRAPEAELVALAEERFRDLGRPAALVLPDGRVAAGDFDPPGPLVRATVNRLRAGAGAWRERPFRTYRGRDPRAVPGRPGLAARRAGVLPLAAAPVQRNGRVVAAVLIARGRPAGAVARELAPWLALGLAGLLGAGTALASLAVFRPAHSRLRDLEEAARRFGAGDLTARALERGGDEVAAVAHAFNRMADEAAAREAALVEADRARRQLLADVTHELRTPLTAIRGYAETLALPAFAPASAEGQRFVHIVDVEAQRLERLVNDLLDLARFDAGAAAFDRTPVAVAALFSRVLDRHGPTAQAAGVTLTTAIDPGADIVPGDARRLEQVVQNLTANAIRHTPAAGSVRWRARPAGDAVVLEVTDTGEGIGPEHLPHVFDRFYKADPARAGSTGTGLGLSIVKAIVDRHGGRVSVHSTRGAGTTFEVVLPR